MRQRKIPGVTFMNVSEEEYQDFQEYNEEPEECGGEMIDCPHCAKPVRSDALRCLYCGESLEYRRDGGKNLKTLLILGLVIILIILVVGL